MLQCPCLYLACDGETSILIFKVRKRKYQSPRLSWNEWPAVPQMTGGASGKGHSCQCRRDERSWFDPWFRKIPWRRACNPLQYSCLQNSMDRGPRKAIVHSVTESWTWLKWLNAHEHTHTQTNSDNAHSTSIVSNIYFLFPTLPLIPSLGKMPLGLQFYAAGLNTDSFNSICSVHYWPPNHSLHKRKNDQDFYSANNALLNSLNYILGFSRRIYMSSWQESRLCIITFLSSSIQCTQWMDEWMT